MSYAESGRCLLHDRLERGHFSKMKLERSQHGAFIRGEDRGLETGCVRASPYNVVGRVKWAQCSLIHGDMVHMHEVMTYLKRVYVIIACFE